MLSEDDHLPVIGDRGAGAPLTSYERRRIDFTRTTVVHARWCKAAAVMCGVDDWLAYYDSRLSVGEHVSILRRVSADPRHGPTLRATSGRVLGHEPR